MRFDFGGGMNIRLILLAAMLFSQAHASNEQVSEIELTGAPRTVQLKNMNIKFILHQDESQICRDKVCKFDIFIDNIRVTNTMLNHTMTVGYYENKSIQYIKISNHSAEYFGDIFISICPKLGKSCECELSREASEIARRKDFPEIDTGSQNIYLGSKKCAYVAKKTQWR